MIIKRKLKTHYAHVPNSTADDPNLAADALGVLVYLLAKPHDWKVSVANIRGRFGIARNRVYDILRELTEAGYIERSQARNPESRFVSVEYIVFDSPEARAEAMAEPENKPATPLPDIREAVEVVPSAEDARHEHPVSERTASRNSASPNKGRIQRNKKTNPPSEGLAPPEGAFEEKGTGNHPPPSQPATLNARIWTEAKAILRPKEFGCVPEWLRRVKDRPKGLETLLGIIETARRQGTGQPVPYIVAALNREFPPPPDPKTFSRERWELMRQAAINTRHWSEDWGPRPGERACLMPADLVSPELLRAVALRRAA